MKKFIALTGLACFLATPVAAKDCDCASKITKEQILASQKAWGDGIVAIGAATDYQAAALKHIDSLYAYDLGTVLFKPTKARTDQFRGTKDEALSYFVGGSIPEDKGFALAPFKKVRFENDAMTMDCDSAIAMGNYYFTGPDNKEIKVEYTFGYVQDKGGNVKINLQHSSLPYNGQ